MKICFVQPILSGYSGPERALEGFAKGLSSLGHKVVIATIWTSESNVRRLEGYSELFYLHIHDGDLKGQITTDMLFGHISRKLRRLFKKHKEELQGCDVGLLTYGCGFDAMLNVGREIFGTVGYYCQCIPGPMNIWCKPFRQGINRRMDNITIDIITFLSPYLVRRFWKLSEFDVLITNVEWLASFLTYATGCEISGVVYPPVDVKKFMPTRRQRNVEKYCLAVGGRRDVMFEDVDTIADSIKVMKCGHDTVEGCINLGYVPDDELVELYSNAHFTLFPPSYEAFGYVPLESMACETPVLGYRWQGLYETVVDGKTGWLVNTKEELYKKAMDLWHNGYDPNIREQCRKHVLKNFSIETSAQRLMEVLEKHV